MIRSLFTTSIIYDKPIIVGDTCLKLCPIESYSPMKFTDFQTRKNQKNQTGDNEIPLAAESLVAGRTPGRLLNQKMRSLRKPDGITVPCRWQDVTMRVKKRILGARKSDRIRSLCSAETIHSLLASSCLRDVCWCSSPSFFWCLLGTWMCIPLRKRVITNKHIIPQLSIGFTWLYCYYS